jgi:hypothetical protein
MGWSELHIAAEVVPANAWGMPMYIRGFGIAPGQVPVSTGRTPFILTSVVPEPGSFGLCALALAGAVARRRRK